MRVNREASIAGGVCMKRRGRLVDENVGEVRGQIGLGFVNHCKDFAFTLSEKGSH